MFLEISLGLPRWIESFPGRAARFPDDPSRMRLAIQLAGENVRHGTGGPFGAAVFERATGRLVSLGVNSVQRLNNSVLHAEVMALMLAQARLKSFTLHAPGLPEHELFTSCEPCAMCLGAILWSGVRRIVCGASKSMAEAIGFDEGPVFPESYRHLEAKGIQVVRGLMLDEARQPFKLYQENSGVIYNG